MHGGEQPETTVGLMEFLQAARMPDEETPGETLYFLDLSNKQELEHIARKKELASKMLANAQMRLKETKAEIGRALASEKYQEKFVETKYEEAIETRDETKAPAPPIIPVNSLSQLQQVATARAAMATNRDVRNWASILAQQKRYARDECDALFAVVQMVLAEVYEQEHLLHQIRCRQACLPLAPTIWSRNILPMGAASR
ncbi:hypothetical protein SO694_0001805 [Aureococcus anophagefferens]|uniref:Uncharacterized protein n=1 Tax=Aureococcus anophagefferens TaxID=44056 RepID=A0ABR1G0B4_AURAN